MDVAISWSNRRLTDGHIPADRIRLLGGTRSQAEALVASSRQTYFGFMSEPAATFLAAFLTTAVLLALIYAAWVLAP